MQSAWDDYDCSTIELIIKKQRLLSVVLMSALAFRLHFVSAKLGNLLVPTTNSLN